MRITKYSEAEAAVRCFTMRYTNKNWIAYKQGWDTAIRWERARLEELADEEMDEYYKEKSDV